MRRAGGFAIVLLLCARAARAEGTPTSADEHFRRGREQFLAKDYANAEKSFTAALRVFVSPNARLYLARSQRQLGRYDEAAESYERTEAEAQRLSRTEPDYTKTAEVAHAELLDVSRRIGWLTVVLLDEARGGLDGEIAVRSRRVAAVRGQPARLAVLPGTVHLEATSPGRAVMTRDLEVLAGDDRTIEIVWQRSVTERRPPPPAAAVRPPPRSETSPLLYGALGLGAVGLGGFAGLQLAAAGRFSYLEDHGCKASPTPACQAAREDGPRYEAISVIALGVGVLGLAAATYLLVRR
jgi:hypothetical protein